MQSTIIFQQNPQPVKGINSSRAYFRLLVGFDYAIDIQRKFSFI